MASLYVAEDTVTARLGSRATAVLDRDNDGSSDSGLLASFIESAGRIINGRLAQRYGSSNLPFANITDTPDTPDLIQEIALYLTLSRCYEFINPNGTEAENFFNKAEGLLIGLRTGELDLEDFSARADASEGRHIVKYTAEDPILSGVDDNDADRLRGV